MVYSCGYWKKAQNLDQAQEDKLELVCQKLGLKKGMKVLDIGGGWGSFTKYAAEKYRVHVVMLLILQFLKNRLNWQKFFVKDCRLKPDLKITVRLRVNLTEWYQ